MIAVANTGCTIDLTLSALYTQMVLELWGTAGGILFNVALVAAALTTAVGAVSSTSEIWVEILGDKIKGDSDSLYKKICMISCVLSAIVSFMDLDTIVRVVGPVLDACYPPAIVISLFYCFCPNADSVKNLRAGKWAMIGAFVVSLIELAARYSDMFSFGWNWIVSLFNTLPLSSVSLAWLPVSVIIFIVFKLIPVKDKAIS